MKYQVVFQPSGRCGEVEAGTTLLAAAQGLGVHVEASCGGAGVCGKCVVTVKTARLDELDMVSSMAHMSPLTDEERRCLADEDIERGARLACQARVFGDVAVTVPEAPQSDAHVILESGEAHEVVPDPVVRRYELRLAPATLDDARDDMTRLIDGLHGAGVDGDVTIDTTVLRELPSRLRRAGYHVFVTMRRGLDESAGVEVIRVEPFSDEGNRGNMRGGVGIAVDVGTTTIAAYLVELESGRLIGTASRMNSEIAIGGDVLARISYAIGNEHGRERLQKLVIGDINDLVRELVSPAQMDVTDVDEMVLVYNTAMEHLTLGLDPSFVGKSPFVPAVSAPLDLKARDLGIAINPAAYVHSLPIEAGFVGADNVAVLIAEEPYKSEKTRLIIDIGTNGEIDLGSRTRLLSTSCATGPALEGAAIKHGMRAARGAIERVKIDAKTYEPSYKVIGNDKWQSIKTGEPVEENDVKPRGICGSGIIDVMAALYDAGVIAKSGRIKSALASVTTRVRETGGMWEYVVAWASETETGRDIVVTQADVRAVQLAKAALYVGARYLMEQYGVSEVDEVILAGAFGSYIDKKSAMTIGMFPACDIERVRAVGNAAGEGARMALISLAKRREAARVAREVEFVETAVEPDFQERFMDALAFGER